MADNNEIFELLTKMYSKMQEIEEDIKNIDIKMDKGFNEVSTRIDNISNGIGTIIAHEVSNELSEQLNSIKTDVKFIKRKVQDTEEDVFVIQDHLKIIK